MVSARKNRLDPVNVLASAKVRASLLAALVVLTLLVCHATVGGTSRLTLEPMVAVSYQSSEVVGSFASQSTEPFSSHAYYYVAVICTLLLDAFAGVFLADARRRLRAIFYPGTGQPLGSIFLRGDVKVTQPMLQVFRL